MFLKLGQSDECEVILHYILTCCSLIIINKAEHLPCLYQPLRFFKCTCLSRSCAQLHWFFVFLLTNMQEVWFLYGRLYNLLGGSKELQI